MLSIYHALLYSAWLLTAEGISIPNAFHHQKAKNLTRRAIHHGFAASEHEVVTEDGYILKMFRIREKEKYGPPVLIMHGLTMSADSWVDSGPGVALAYLLAASGRDVWLGNVRGNVHSRAHSRLDPDSDPAYWLFSINEIGLYDISAMIDGVLDVSGASTLSYIGFSQGAGAFFAMCDERPQYCKKVDVMVALAPSTRHLHTTAFGFRTMVQFFEAQERLLHKAGIFEAMPEGGLIQQFLERFCPISQLTLRVCEFFKDLIDASHPNSISDEAIGRLVQHFPAGTSVRNLARFGQAMKTKKFQKHDYGKSKNSQVYGTPYPPIYNISATDIPVVVLAGRNDGVVDIRDVKWVVKQLPKLLDFSEVKDPLWSHLDMCYSRDVPKYIFPKIDKYLSMYSHKKDYKVSSGDFVSLDIRYGFE